MSKNTWFKHYNEAHEGHLIGNLIASKQYEAALLWWVLLELVSRFEDENNRGTCTIPLARIARSMNMTQPRVEGLLDQLTLNSPSSHDCTISTSKPRLVSISIRKWLELQENRGGKNQAKNDQNTDRSKRLEVRIKNKEVVDGKSAENPQHQHQNFSNEFFEKEKKAGEEQSPAKRKEQHSENKRQTFEIIEELQGNSTLEPVLKFISPAVQQNWVNRYEKTWLIDVLINAISYHSSKENALNASKINDWGLRLQRWLAREKKPCLIGLNDITEATINRWSAELDEEQKNRGFQHGL